MDKITIEVVMERFASACESCAKSAQECATEAERNIARFSAERIIRTEYARAAYKILSQYKYISGMYTIMLELYTGEALPREEGLRVGNLYSDFFTAYSEASSRVDYAYNKKLDELYSARREKEGGTGAD